MMKITRQLILTVDPGDSCSDNGAFESGICKCKENYYGRLCESFDIPEYCKLNYDCYSCDTYKCHYDEEMERSHVVLSNFQSCSRFGSTTAESHKDESDHSTDIASNFVIHEDCVNITSQCFPVYDCTCPSGFALLSSHCLKDSLHRNIGFFLIIMGIITAFSYLFEFLSHNVEHQLAKRNQKGLLAVTQNLKAELAMVGVIGLFLFIAEASQSFEHAVHNLGGNEQIIEGVHFLVFFFLCGYFVSLLISLILSKFVNARRLALYEDVFHNARMAALKGEDYQTAKEEHLQKARAKSCIWIQSSFEEYSLFRKFFMDCMRSELSKDQLVFFRFDRYMKICMNDFMSSVSRVTWMVWLATAFNFFTDIFLGGYFIIISRVIVFTFLSVTTAVTFIKRAQLKSMLKGRNNSLISDEPMSVEDPDLILNKEALKEKYKQISPQHLERAVHVALWLCFGNVFAHMFNLDLPLFAVVVNVGMFVLLYVVITFVVAPTLSGLLYNGPLINKQFVEEVLKRYSCAEEYIWLDQWRTESEIDQLPNFDD